jgi:hypothetical protein
MRLMGTLMLKAPIVVIHLILYNEEGLVSSLLHRQELLRMKRQEGEL